MRRSDYNDLGNILLAFLMLWAYLSFSQLLIIWAGNLKEEIPWYQQRAFGGWQPIGVALVVLHFFVPLLLLLQRGVKRRLRTLSFVAVVDRPAHSAGHILDRCALMGQRRAAFPSRRHFCVAGRWRLWVAAFFWQLKKLPLLPLHDPRFEGVLLHEHGD